MRASIIFVEQDCDFLCTVSEAILENNLLHIFLWPPLMAVGYIVYNVPRWTPPGGPP